MWDHDVFITIGYLMNTFHDLVFEEKSWSKHFNSVSDVNICSMKQHKTTTLNNSDGQSVYVICCQAQGKFYQLIKPVEISDCFHKPVEIFDCFQLYFTKSVFNCWPHWSHSLLRNAWIFCTDVFMTKWFVLGNKANQFMRSLFLIFACTVWFWTAKKKHWTNVKKRT